MRGVYGCTLCVSVCMVCEGCVWLHIVCFVIRHDALLVSSSTTITTTTSIMCGLQHTTCSTLHQPHPPPPHHHSPHTPLAHSMISSLRALLLGEDFTSDPLSQILQASLAWLTHGRVALDVKQVSQYLTLAFVGFVSTNSLRAFLKQLGRV